MSRFLKNKILDMVDIMLKANQPYSEFIMNGQEQELYQLSEQLQNAAIQTGGMIETRVGEGAAPIPVLEMYCEHLYENIQELKNGTINIERAISTLSDDLHRAKALTDQTYPGQLEILFCPYKVSMWDSLESVYEAAVRDGNYDVKVMALPYYDKNSDGSLGQMHNEADLFDKSIRLISCEEYNIEEHYPDIIFIHNPYDGVNFVTSVDSKYYAKNLRNYTDKLIYIPYFVNVNDYVHKEFCTLPGTIYSDYVILQSEKVRQQYIAYYKDMFRQIGREKMSANAEQKFLALGSPKFDKILESNNSQTDIPEQWNELINAQGIHKPVILYNTHINNLMPEYGALFMKKMKRVHDYFEQRKDVVLLWRPHPLSVATLEAMNRDLLETYQQIVNEYKNRGFGIYDDSPDMNRAVAISDAYFGDNSSLIALFQEAGKPVMLEDLSL